MRLARSTLHTVVLIGLLSASPAEAARNFQLKGSNELGGGIGFAGALTDWTPGGFKWFNDYSRKLTELVWLNVQFNITVGEDDHWGERCWWDRGHYRCEYYEHGGHFDGYAIELAVGAKLKWRLRNVPLQFHAKFGGAFDILVFGEDRWVHPSDPDYGDRVMGFAFLAFRGGFGVRYFFVPTFGLGAELVPTLGPSWINHNVGMEFYASIDFNIGVEWRF